MDLKKSEMMFNDLVMEWNCKINLVSRKKDNIIDLINDSKIFLEYIPEGKYKVLDLGTGGGIPGIVIKMHRPEIELILLDSISKKTKAVIDIITKLKLNKTKVICSRAEDLSKDAEYKNCFDIVVSRSVAALPELLKWSRHLIKPRGFLLTLKGSDVDDEIIKSERLSWLDRIETHSHGEKLMLKCIIR